MLMVVFTIGGTKYDITKEGILKALSTLVPEEMTGNRRYYIVFEGKKYPIKQVIAAVTGLPRVAFTAMDAYRILTKLGFDVKELER